MSAPFFIEVRDGDNRFGFVTNRETVDTYRAYAYGEPGVAYHAGDHHDNVEAGAAVLQMSCLLRLEAEGTA